MMGEVSLRRFEQFLLGVSCELRPALAEGGPAVSVRDFGHMTIAVVASLHLVRPTERVGL
jgi:hypothetical protein